MQQAQFKRKSLGALWRVLGANLNRPELNLQGEDKMLNTWQEA